MTMTSIAQLIIGVTDLAAALLFLYGLKRMSSPVTAPSGIFVAGLGMLVAVLASFFYVFDVGAAAKPHLMVNVGLGVVALVVGGGVAWWAGKKVAMTAMPQMVAIYNGMGGGAAGAIAAVELFGGKVPGTTQLVVTLLGALIGAISLSGSLIAWAKLQGVIKKPLRIRGQQYFNILVLLGTLAVAGNLVYVAQGLPMAIFILSEFISQIPKDLRDAARCDGVPETRIFFEVIAPLLRPAIATVAVFTMVPVWNDLWFPLLLTSSDSTHTITLGVQQFLGQYTTDWNSVLSALSLAILPVVVIYVIFSRQLISGLTAGAVK